MTELSVNSWAAGVICVLFLATGIAIDRVFLAEPVAPIRGCACEVTDCGLAACRDILVNATRETRIAERDLVYERNIRNG